MSDSRILLQVTGSIAAFKAATLASMLIESGAEVQCVMSEGAGYFIGESTFEGLTGRPVLGDVFERGRAHDHIRLAEWADLLLLYPASANHITRLRAGLADDLIGCLFLANNFRSPYWIAPAMNSHMLEHPAVAECAVVGIDDQLKGQLPMGFLVISAGVNRPHADIVKDCVKLVRDQIGPVAAFKMAKVVKRLPKTRSGKILRGTMRKIADSDAYKVPATIEDPAVLDEIAESLKTIGYAGKG